MGCVCVRGGLAAFAVFILLHTLRVLSTCEVCFSHATTKTTSHAEGEILMLQDIAATMTIRWKLNQLMFERGVKNHELVEITGLHANTISKLKNLREMPDRLEKSTLDLLCKALNCQPGELLVYIPSEGDEL